jgi:WD40 repeat protein
MSTFAKALYDYDPSLWQVHRGEFDANDELPLKINDIVEVLNQDDSDDPNWIRIKKGNQIGLIPSNYIVLIDNSNNNNNNNNKSSSRNSKGNNIKNVSDLKSIKESREEAEKKIESLRSAVLSYEQGEVDNTDTDNIPLINNEKNINEQDNNNNNINNNNSNNTRKQSNNQRNIKNNSNINNNSELDTINSIEKIIKQKIGNSSRENILIEQIKSLMHNHLSIESISESKAAIAPVIQPQNKSLSPRQLHVKNPTKSKNSHVISSGYGNNNIKSKQQNLIDSPVEKSYSSPSLSNQKDKKIYDNNDNNEFIIRSPSNFESPINKVPENDFTPEIVEKPKIESPSFFNSPSSKNNSNRKEKNSVIQLSPLQKSTVIEGIRYPQCRSVVYPPSLHSPSKMLVEESASDSRLSLRHVHGYDGDPNRHGGAIRGKNVMFVKPDRIIFPAAAVVIVMDIESTQQSFFSGHTDDVTSVTVHPERKICASGQMGKGGRICLWDQSLLEPGQREYNHLIELYMNEGVRGVGGINFSGDGQFLVALASDESRKLVIFDWYNKVPVATTLVGHADVYQMGFNPYLYVGIDRVEGSSSPRDNSVQACYTLVSCGGRQIKFWTLKKISELDEYTPTPDSGFKGRPVAIPKKKQKWKTKYILEGNTGKFSKSGQDLPEFTCFVSICDTNTSKKDIVAKSRIFTGTSTGDIYIWRQTEDTSSSSFVTWQARGSLIGIVNDIAESPILDLDYAGNMYLSDGDYQGDHQWGDDTLSSRQRDERIITGSKDGILNVWKINRSGDSKSSPFEHISSVICGTGSEAPRSINWDIAGRVAIIGTTGNSLLYAYGQGMTDISTNNEDETSKIFIEPIIRSHSRKVCRVAAHPFKNFYVTVSNDKTARLWNSISRREISSHHFSERISCVSFTPDGGGIALGNELGELIVVDCGALHNDDDSFETNDWKLRYKHSIAAKNKLNQEEENGNQSNRSDSETKKSKKEARLLEKKYEVMELKYSPTSEILAVGCRDNLIHILCVSNNYNRVAVCRGHSSYIKNIDFSIDGNVMQSTDNVREILFWNVTSGKQINNAYAVRNIDWNSWTCVHGWPVQGVFNGLQRQVMDGEINSVCRSSTGDLLVAGGSNTVNSAVKLFKY